MRSTTQKSLASRVLRLVVLLASAILSSASLADRSPSSTAAQGTHVEGKGADGIAAAPASEDASLTEMLSVSVYKHRFCRCCGKWVDHLESRGLQVPVINSSNEELSVLKGEWRIPNGMQGCHTGVVQDKYVFEGHVPARLIRQFLSSPPPDSLGLMVPGMPEGSPGMYGGGGFKPYIVYLLMRNGDYRFYARIEEPESATGSVGED
ncbi:DUF411 domain-containing protein [Microbulbifer yueqingensis]|uniref:Uncharacterized conserved protein n=1 Tax=Microbulbifer yueqingensis TaxID=658219 RepID=A0A1G8ZRC2_9GAMM|nr:DUF411 domain-containing protein [Microbulbifer yueqingensis]SDK17666.1 Uncharacterized conserved protein [Microbulbifer yueqingensis]